MPTVHANSTEYIPVSLATLTSEAPEELDLFVKTDDGEDFRLYRSSELDVTQADLIRLAARGIKRLYIRGADNELYQEHLRQMLEADSTRSAPMPAKLGALSDVVRDVLQESFCRIDPARAVEASKELGEASTQLICDDQFIAGDLFNVLHHDYTTFTHSANVAYYCTMLAKELGYTETEINQISTGGFLHDLGKLKIPEQILCKPGRLDDSEFRVIKRHPLDGFKELAHRDDLSMGQLMMVYQHHEKLDGSGYPTGSVSSEIHDWAKICSVADVFEALTSVRPYRKPMSFQGAIELMERDKGRAFEPEILECWSWITRHVSEN